MRPHRKIRCFQEILRVLARTPLFAIARIFGNSEIRICSLLQHAAAAIQASCVPRNGCEQDESALSGTTRAALAVTARKRKASLSGKEEALWSNVAPSSTSPQCQPTTDKKKKDLDRIEHPLHNRYIRFTGRNHRLPSPCLRTSMGGSIGQR